MVLAGALKPLIDMAKSGDAYCETEAVAALANLAMGEDNQKQFMKEGGMAAIEVMTLSKNPRVQHNAKRLISRLRLAKMRTAARFAGQMATQQKEADCAAGQNLRVASYNVLSSKLCEPGYFIKCAKENLDPPTRLKRVQALLEQETKKHAVVCLQEVSREWSGDLHAFFARQGYQFTTGLYGNPFNGCRARRRNQLAT